MKKLLLLLSATFIFSFLGQAQSMRIDLFSPWNHDTVIYNQQVDINVAITNTGNTPILDSLGVVIAKDTMGAQVIDTIYYNLSGPLNAGDSVVINPTWLISTQKYTPGNNITVIWPIKDNFTNDNFLFTNTFVNDVQKLQEYNLSFNIYPNPSSNTLFIDTDEKEFRVQLIDLTGKIIREGSDKRISIIDLPSGIYLIRLELSDGSTGCKRFQKL
jgi:hypothetical protein